MASKLLSALLTPDRSNDVLANDSLFKLQQNSSNNNLSHQDFIPRTAYVSDNGAGSFVSDQSEDSIIQRLFNGSSSGMFPDVPSVSNTPLTAPELGLVTVSSADSFGVDGNLLGEAHTSELAWLIPAVIGGILLFVFLALLMFFGIRTLELRLMACCFRTFGCCDRGAGREERRALNSEVNFYDASNADL